MANHVIKANLVLSQEIAKEIVSHETNEGAKPIHYDSYDMSPWGGIVIKQASFNDKGVDKKNG